MPANTRWVFLFVVREFAEEACAISVALQGLTTLLSEQRRSLNALVSKYCTMTAMDAHPDEVLDSFDKASNAICRPFALSHASVLTYLGDLDV